jgi:hypothetical protein
MTTNHTPTLDQLAREADAQFGAEGAPSDYVLATVDGRVITMRDYLKGQA